MCVKLCLCTTKNAFKTKNFKGKFVFEQFMIVNSLREKIEGTFTLHGACLKMRKWQQGFKSVTALDCGSVELSDIS